jgi:acetyl-CoA carboxylase biotin carboxyl carrier protein
MNPEDMKELKELIEFLKDNQIGEFDLDRGDLKVRIKFAQESTSAADLAGLTRLLNAAGPATPATPAPVAVAVPATAHAAAPTPEAAPVVDENTGLHIVKSPIVGTFYESPSPGTQAFVKPGDQIESGQVLCIVEAMKLMNEIESDAAGEIVKRLVANGQPVEYGQPLFALRLR